MAGFDWLFTVGLDTSQADNQALQFVQRTSNVFNRASGAFKITPTINVGPAMGQLSQLTAATRSAGSSFSAFGQSAFGAGGGVDFLGRVARNTFFKFIEYDLMMKAFTGTMRAFGSALNQAAGVQVEQALQKQYGGLKNLNEAYDTAVVLAKQWGDNIIDVMQAMGMWAKVTQDQYTAELLTNEALKLHAASGIAVNDVTTTSISLMSKLHMTVSDYLKTLDQVTKASQMMALPMRNVPGASGGKEGIREILEGLTEASASLRAANLDTASSIAVIAAQIQGLGESGKTAGTKLSTMLAGIESAKSGQAFDNIVNGMAKASVGAKDLTNEIQNMSKADVDSLFSKMERHVPELLQAVKDGVVTVRPQMKESLLNLFSLAPVIEQWKQQIREGARGALDTAALSYMNTYSGSIERLKVSFQALLIILGNQVLPAAIAFTKWLGQDLFPAIEKNLPTIEHLIKELAEVAGGLLAFEVLTRIGALWSSFGGILGAVRGTAASLSLVLGDLNITNAMSGKVASASGQGFAALGTSMRGVAAALPGLIVLVSGLAMVGNMLIDNWAAKSAQLAQQLQIESSTPAGRLSSYEKDLADLTGQNGVQAQQDAAKRRGLASGTFQPGMVQLGQGSGVFVNPGDMRRQIGSLTELVTHYRPYAAKNPNPWNANLAAGTPTFDSLIKQIEAASKMSFAIPGQALDLPGSTLGTKTSGGASVTSLALASTANLKREYMGTIAAEKEAVKVGLDEVATAKLKIKAYGETDQRIQDLIKGYNDAAIAEEHIATTQTREAAALKADIDAKEKLLKTLKPGTKDYLGVQKSISEDTEAMKKASAAALEAAAAVKKYAAAKEAAASNSAWEKKLQDEANKLLTLADSAKKASDSLLKTNLDIYAGLTGMSPENKKFMDDMLAGMDKVDAVTQEIDKYNQEISKINQDILDHKRAATDQDIMALDHAKNMVDSLTQQLGIYKQLYVLQAENARIQASPLYTATLGTFDKYAKQGIDGLVNSLFDNLGKKSTSWLRSMLADWVSQIVQAWESQAVKNVVNRIFGVKDASQVQLQAGKLMGTAAVMQMQAAQLMAGVSTGGVGIGGGTDAVSAVTSVIDLVTSHLGLSPQKSQATANSIATAASSTASTSKDIHKALTTQLPDTLGLPSDGFLGLFESLFGGLGGGGGGGLSGILGNSGFGALVTKAGGLSIAGLLTTGLIGASIGGGIGSAIGGPNSTNKIWGSIGGGLGAVLGAGGGILGSGLEMFGFAGGPLGAIAGLVIGSLIGGLFGNHGPNPHDNPDQAGDFKSYMQFLADMTGQSIGNNSISLLGDYTHGQGTATPQGTFGTTPEHTVLEQWVQGVADTSKLTADQLAVYNQLVSLGGKTAGGLNITREDHGVFTLASGQKISVTDFENLVTKADQIVQATKTTASNTSALAPLISINAYGAGPGYPMDLYNLPGLSAQEFAAWGANGQTGGPFGGFTGTTPFFPNGAATAGGGTRGFGGGAGPVPIGSVPSKPVYIQPVASQPLSVTTNLVVDGRTLATVVNAFNDMAANRAGASY